MFRKIMTGILVGGALLALSLPAQAATVNINLYGASAQHLFWNDAADNFLGSQGCTGVAQDEYNSGHGITRGTCGADTVYIRYSSKASFDGIYAVKGAVNTDNCGNAFQRKMVDEATCTDWVLGGTACIALKCQEVTIGASDVDGSSFVQKSKGKLKGPNTGSTTVVDRNFPASGIDTAGLIPRQPVVVPFGFFANKSVTKTKCLGPDPLSPAPTAHKVVSTWGYQCYDPDTDGHSVDCIGFYACDKPQTCVAISGSNTCNNDPLNTCNTTTNKCTVQTTKSCTTNQDCDGLCSVTSRERCNKTSGICPTSKCSTITADGCGSSGSPAVNWGGCSDLCSAGTNADGECTRANQCPDVTLANTKCERIPIDNISRLMATQIYSAQAIFWQDFGAWYDADGNPATTTDPIVACLRHAGSGTHATLDWAVMRGFVNDWGWKIVEEETPGAVWFNDGSGDEMYCINTLAGAIGYADADQLEGTSNFKNVHALKYNGVEPRRTKVRNGEYDFYSNQWLYFKTTPTTLEEALITYASDPANIPVTKAKFWATKDEMVFNKGDDRGYPGYAGASNPQTP